MRYTQQNLPNVTKATGRQLGLMGKSRASFKWTSSVGEDKSTRESCEYTRAQSNAKRSQGQPTLNFPIPGNHQEVAGKST